VEKNCLYSSVVVAVVVAVVVVVIVLGRECFKNDKVTP
jgi:hypothetical protein